MAVTEALMQLFVKELVSIDRLTGTVKRFASWDEKDQPADQEEALILWINKCAEALQDKAEDETKHEEEVIATRVSRKWAEIHQALYEFELMSQFKPIQYSLCGLT